jgi:diacylglycerol kinase family enzyme
VCPSPMLDVRGFLSIPFAIPNNRARGVVGRRCELSLRLYEYACEVSAPVCLIVNPSAGGGKAGRVLTDVLDGLRAHGFEVHSELTRDLDHARELALVAARAGETVVCLSGDGMVGAVADALREIPEALLGVLPGGRGNDLARVLGIPADPIEACATIAAGFSRRLDLGEVDGKAFVGIASVGFDSDANRIANEAPAWLGGLVYAYGALRALLSWKPARFEIELSDQGGSHEDASKPTGAAADDHPRQRYSFSGYTVGACNSKTYGGGMRVAPDALLDDGLLDVLALESVSKLRFLTRILPKVFSGAHTREPSVRCFRAREVSISADRPFTMYADGDPIGELPLRVRVLPGAVRVLVPAGGEGADAFLGDRDPDVDGNPVGDRDPDVSRNLVGDHAPGIAVNPAKP